MSPVPDLLKLRPLVSSTIALLASTRLPEPGHIDVVQVHVERNRIECLGGRAGDCQRGITGCHTDHQVRTGQTGNRAARPGVVQTQQRAHRLEVDRATAQAERTVEAAGVIEGNHTCTLGIAAVEGSGTGEGCATRITHKITIEYRIAKIG
eukprot:UN03651